MRNKMLYLSLCNSALLLGLAYFLYEEMAERKAQLVQLRDQIQKIYSKIDSKADLDVITSSETDCRLDALEMALNKVNDSLWPKEKDNKEKKVKILHKEEL